MTITQDKSSILAQFFVGFIANLATLSAGAAYGWSSPVGLKLASNDTSQTPIGETIGTESAEYGWMSSLLIIGALISPLFASFLANRIGRKWNLLISAVFFIIANILFIFAYNIWIMYVGRIIQGCGAGFVITTMPLYIGEISTDNVRGAMGALMTLFLTGGGIYVYAFGAYTSYYVMQYACLIPPIVFAITFVFMPESPYYLLAKGKKEDASLQFFRRQTVEQLQNEIAMIQSLNDESAQRKGSIKAMVTNRGNLKAFFICWGLISFQQLTGLQTVLINAQIIIQESNSSIEPGLASILMGLVQLIVGGFSPIVIEYVGRKTLLISSTVFCCAGLMTLGTCFYLDETGVDTSSIRWLPLVALIVFVGFSSIGFLPLPFIVIGEIFSSDVKFIASALLAINGAIVAFLLTLFYPSMVALGGYVAFWFYAVLCIFAIIFVWCVMFETKGLSLQEIQDKLNKR